MPLLCAFHQSYKISEAVFDRWCRVLHAVPGAVLWLLAREHPRRETMAAEMDQAADAAAQAAP